MAATYRDAEDVRDVAVGIIRSTEAHRWLAQFGIAYLSRDAKTPSNAWGKAVAIPRLYQHLTGGLQGAVVVELLPWKVATPDQRMALIDHLLSHFEQTEAGDLATGAPEVAEFAEVIARHGLWRPELQRAGKAVRAHELRMPLDETPAPHPRADDAEDKAEDDRGSDGVPVTITTSDGRTVDTTTGELRRAATAVIEMPEPLSYQQVAAAVLVLRAIPGYAARPDDEEWLQELHREHPDADLAVEIGDCAVHWGQRDKVDDTLNVRRPPQWRRRIKGWLKPGGIDEAHAGAVALAN